MILSNRGSTSGRSTSTMKDADLRTALEQCLTGVLTIDAGFFVALTTDLLRIDKALADDAAMIGLITLRRCCTIG